MKQLLARWKSLPGLLKLVFAVHFIGLLLSIVGGYLNPPGHYFIFSIELYDREAFLAYSFINIVLAAIFLLGIWMRASWAVVLGLAYNGFFLINGAFYFPKILELGRMIAAASPSLEEEFRPRLWLMWIGYALSAGINIGTLAILYGKRKHFKVRSEA